MKFIFVGLFCCSVLLNAFIESRPHHEDDDPFADPPARPYWSYSTSDFWNYVEHFRSLGAYHRINDLARTFFAHYPIGDTLGYEVSEHEH
ncbi:otospiralin [Pleurodeles waltl]|uniref:otospiralin n=1 Tax=Pleurodeles waltl TaxID=8319 RepID=UPI003709BB31